MNNISNIVVYNNGELELKISVNEETIWLTQSQMSELFDTSTDNIGLHLKNIYKEKELNGNLTIEDFSVVRQEGNRKVTRIIKHYNLDAIICVGYRVSSSKATKFRQWATSILKNYIQNGYAINGEKITNERFVFLENDVNTLKSQMSEVKSLVKNNKIETNQGIFYDGQIYDSYIFVLKTFKDSHDRFIILEKKDIFHIGASLKDLGKKWFAFSKIDISANDLISKLV